MYQYYIIIILYFANLYFERFITIVCVRACVVTIKALWAQVRQWFRNTTACRGACIRRAASYSRPVPLVNPAPRPTAPTRPSNSAGQWARHRVTAPNTRSYRRSTTKTDRWWWPATAVNSGSCRRHRSSSTPNKVRYQLGPRSPRPPVTPP